MYLLADEIANERRIKNALSHLLHRTINCIEVFSSCSYEKPEQTGFVDKDTFWFDLKEGTEAKFIYRDSEARRRNITIGRTGLAMWFSDSESQ